MTMTTEMKNTINKLVKLKQSYKKIGEEVEKELAEYLKEQINENYDNSSFQEENGDRSVEANKNDGHYKVTVKGSQVLYTEFGTGTEGERHPHPDKGKYNLNPYNYATKEHGGTIRLNPDKNTNASKEGIPVEEWYWTYTDSSGNKVYTQGVPAGMQVYNAVNSTKKHSKEISKRKVADVLSKL